MLEFPYVELPGRISRPIIAVVLEGPTGRRLLDGPLDGRLDTGSDRTLFPQREAQAVGLQSPANPDGHIRTAGGVSIAYRLIMRVRGFPCEFSFFARLEMPRRSFAWWKPTGCAWPFQSG